MRRKASEWEVEWLRRRAWFQFGPDAARALFPRGSTIEVELSSRGRIRYVYVDGKRIFTLRPNDGLFSLSLEAARMIVASVPPPRLRVVVDGSFEIRGSILAAGVRSMDPELRPGDECIVVDPSDRVLAVGRVRIPPSMLEGLRRGETVRIRRAVKR